MTSPLVSVLAWTAALAWGQTASPPDAAAIAQAAAKLGDSSYAVRQQATEDLWRAGSAAEEELHRALKSRDPEVRTRAAAVLHRLRLGIGPQTPPEALVLIDQFLYSNSPQDRQRALAELHSKVDLRLLFNLQWRRGHPCQVAVELAVDLVEQLRGVEVADDDHRGVVRR